MINPIDLAKATAEVFVGPQVWMAQQAVRVTKATAKAPVEAIESIPTPAVDFITMPLQVMQGTMNTGFWVMGHLKLIFIAILAIVLLIVASFVRTAGKAAHQRVRDTVAGKQPVHQAPRSDRAQRKIWGKDWQRPAAQGHAQSVVNPGGTICAPGGLREAKLIAKRSGAGEPVARGNCQVHNGSKLFKVV